MIETRNLENKIIIYGYNSLNKQTTYKQINKEEKKTFPYGRTPGNKYQRN